MRILFWTALMMTWIIHPGASSYAKEWRPAEAALQKDRSSDASIFRTLPALQLTPVNRTAIFNFSYDHLDLSARTSTDELKAEGSTISPALIFNKKYLGYGIVASRRDLQTQYQSTSHKERNVILQQGAGSLFLFNPTPEWETVYLTMSWQSKVFDTQYRTTANDHSPLHKRHVSYQNQWGANLNLNLGKSLALIPWGMLTHHERTKKNEMSNRQTFDTEHFLTHPKTAEYGVDVALRFSHFEVHFGNILGMLLTKDTKNDSSVRDRSASVSLSFQTSDRRSTKP